MGVLEIIYSKGGQVKTMSNFITEVEEILYFAHTENGHYKFWNISKIKITDKNGMARWGIETHWGRIGNKGSKKTKWVYSLTRNKEFNKRIKDKLDKGYREITKEQFEAFEPYNEEKHGTPPIEEIEPPKKRKINPLTARRFALLEE